MMIGDPSLTLDKLGAVKVEVGAGASMGQKIKTDQTTLNISANPNVTSTVYESEDEFSSEQYFLKATLGLGRFCDIFGTIGQARITKFIDGEYGTLVGGGVKLSPPQEGIIKIGLVLQAYRYSSEENKNVSIIDSGTTDDGLSGATVSATGDGHEKITINNYSAALGFGINDIPYVRPYGGVVFSITDGEDEVSFSGTGRVHTTTTQPSGPVSFSSKRKIKSDSSINGIVGMTLNPDKPMGITLEGQFGSGASYFASGFMRF